MTGASDATGSFWQPKVHNCSIKGSFHKTHQLQFHRIRKMSLPLKWRYINVVANLFKAKTQNWNLPQHLMHTRTDHELQNKLIPTLGQPQGNFSLEHLLWNSNIFCLSLCQGNTPCSHSSLENRNENTPWCNEWKMCISFYFIWDIQVFSMYTVFYPMPEISDFQRTNSEFAKSEQKYPIKITLEYAH
jgi:hypothetical protein